MSLLRKLTQDGWLLFSTRCLRMFAFGLLSVVLVLYLAEVGFNGWEIGLLLSLTMAGDTLISLWLTTTADRFGRRRILIVGAILMVLSGIVFLSTNSFILLLIAATLGVISPSGNEIGPFLSIEQAALSHIVCDERRTTVFAWYNLVGSFSTALGALAGGWITNISQRFGMIGGAAFHPVLVAYAFLGMAMVGLFFLLSEAVETRVEGKSLPPKKARLGLHESKGIVFKLSLLFALDALGGGFVIQSVIAYWFYLKFQLDPVLLGTIFFFANLLAGVSALAAGWLARRIGLINTMVFTHLPSNLVLILVPLVPDLNWAIGFLLLRFSISQMDVPARQAYTMAVVQPDERSAAAGVTAVARSVGASISPILASMLVGTAGWMSLPFFLAGGLKIVYDLILFRAFSGKLTQKGK